LGVECCGRAHSQVKIRGFRIELGEIDIYLSQHPLVKDNVTLTRSNKDESLMLVSYIVPHKWSAFSDFLGASVRDGVWSGEDDLVEEPQVYRKLMNEFRHYLKAKLPSYAIPTGKGFTFCANRLVFIPMAKLPLNPNGKVDKPTLPFPNERLLMTAQDIYSSEGISQTEKAVLDIFQSVLPATPFQLNVTDNFFDVGGNSLLAPSVVFATRNRFGVEFPRGVFYNNPTAEEISRKVDELLRTCSTSSEANSSPNYHADALELVNSLPEHYNTAPPPSKDDHIKVFLTGATGFIGAFLIRDLMSRKHGSITLVAHVRASSKEEGVRRLRENCEAYGLWELSWSSRIEVVVGSLDQDNFGLTLTTWQELGSTTDVVIHNGALVRPHHRSQFHSLFPY